MAQHKDVLSIGFNLKLRVQIGMQVCPLIGTNSDLFEWCGLAVVVGSSKLARGAEMNRTRVV